MSRAPMTVGDLNSRQRLTPTGYAEEGYEAKLRQRRPMPIGPAGLPVPDPKAIFRKGEDGLLLKNIARKAYLAHYRRALPHSDEAAVVAEIHRLCLEHFPPADMAVLERYGLARPWEKVAVEFKVAGGYEKAAMFDLPAVTLARTMPTFHVDLGGTSASGLALPESLTPYFTKALALRRDRKRFDTLTEFPGQFRIREGRFPRWFEIERQVPEVASWLAQQRKGASK